MHKRLLSFSHQAESSVQVSFKHCFEVQQPVPQCKSRQGRCQRCKSGPIQLWFCCAQRGCLCWYLTVGASKWVYVLQKLDCNVGAVACIYSAYVGEAVSDASQEIYALSVQLKAERCLWLCKDPRACRKPRKMERFSKHLSKQLGLQARASMG